MLRNLKRLLTSAQMDEAERLWERWPIDHDRFALDCKLYGAIIDRTGRNAGYGIRNNLYFLTYVMNQPWDWLDKDPTHIYSSPACKQIAIRKPWIFMLRGAYNNLGHYHRFESRQDLWNSNLYQLMKRKSYLTDIDIQYWDNGYKVRK